MALLNLNSPDANSDHRTGSDDESDPLPTGDSPGERKTPRRRARRWPRLLGLFLLLLLVAAAGVFLFGRYFAGQAMRANLPQLDGTVTVYGLTAPVTVQRDARGVPHIRAASLNDLVFAQGYVTAQDRLWQMDLLRRHASGQLAAVLGSTLLPHDRLQRTLQMREAADRAFAMLPSDQKHWLEMYARGVNASMIAQEAHLPVEFRMLGYKPTTWAPRDSLLIELVMFQDLTTGYPVKLGREALAAHLSPDLIADLYPVGSWRDHWPGQPAPDPTAPQPNAPDIPLDKSQTKLLPHAARPAAAAVSAQYLATLQQTLALFHPPCNACVAGSNAWAVSSSRSASGKPLLSNDMHLSLSVPELWYEADLDAAQPAPLSDFHVAGVTIPGTPFVIAGHNAHVAWGITNLGADVQDLYIEHTRGTPSGTEYQTSGGEWLPVRYRTEIIHVRGGLDVILDVPLTRHGETDTPIITSAFPGETRSLSLRWTIYDPANVSDPFFAINSAGDWASMLTAFSTWGGPALNLIYADDQGHIGYHAIGRIPIRGDINKPSPLSPVPTDATAPDAASHEWAGYIPFEQLPQAFDPAEGVLVSANARVTPDNYAFPITLNWEAPYRTERIYKVLAASPPQVTDNGSGQSFQPQPQLTPDEMLALQTDVFSQLDQVIAQRLVYSIDHTTGPLKNDPSLRQAADLMRDWDGQVDAGASAPAIVDAARTALWPMLLVPKLVPQLAPAIASGVDLSKDKSIPPDQAATANLWTFYAWGERESVEEQLITHTPARWLPPGFANWDDFLSAVVARGLRNARAPKDLTAWQHGSAYPIDLEHPVFSSFSRLSKALIPAPTGTGPQPQSGDMTTIKQVARSFGPSERFTADLSDPDRTTLNLATGQSGDPASPWYLDQFQSWLRGATYPLPFTGAAIQAAATHTLTLTPR